MIITQEQINELVLIYHDLTEDPEGSELRKALIHIETDALIEANETFDKALKATETASGHLANAVEAALIENAVAHEAVGFVKGYVFARMING